MPLRPRSSVELLDDGVRFVRRDLGPVAVAAALTSVPGSIALSFLTRDGLSAFDSLTDTGDAEATGDGIDQFSVLVLQSLSGSLSLLVVAAVVSHAVARRTEGAEVTGSWGGLLRRAPALIAAWVLVHLVQLVGLLSLGVITVIALVWFVPVTPIVVMEGLGPIAALRRARALVQRRWWPVAGHVLLVALLTTVLSAAVVTMPDELARATLGESAWLVTAAANVLAGIVTTSIVAGATVALYLDLRVRREALDLTTRLEALTGDAAR
ncbi:MAG: hypothetical protein AAFZ07_17895 [Actinomycetota bacterium]